jgi:hypothetical protein
MFVILIDLHAIKIFCWLIDKARREIINIDVARNDKLWPVILFSLDLAGIDLVVVTNFAVVESFDIIVIWRSLAPRFKTFLRASVGQCDERTCRGNDRDTNKSTESDRLDKDQDDRGTDRSEQRVQAPADCCADLATCSTKDVQRRVERGRSTREIGNAARRQRDKDK